MTLPSAPRATVCIPLPCAGVLKGCPAEVARACTSAPGSFWLDSAGTARGETAWSFLGVQASHALTYRNGEAQRETAAGREPLGRASFLESLQRELTAQASQRAVPGRPGAPPFRGGWFALLAYDLGREIERMPVRAADDLAFPEMYLAFHETVLAFDHREGRWWASCTVPTAVRSRDRERHARRRVEELLGRLPDGAGRQECLPHRPETVVAQSSGLREPGAREKRQRHSPYPPLYEGGENNSGTLADAPGDRAVRSNFTRTSYEAAVARALEYIAAGDIYQVNLSQRFEAAWKAPARELYAALRTESPARYGVFAHLGNGRAVCSISPELFLSVRGREVTTRPIKGTRPRGRTPEEDERLSRELLASAKDRAELTMIVDLERNDLGRVCEYGSVRVISAGALETHPTVFHRVATVAGILKAGARADGLLRATFPGGSVTGAPKIRAMEIVEELEPTRRGPYCGALGWIGADGDLELNLAIRTALVDEGARKAWYQAGGGIVADSDPAGEYDETLAKAAAFFSAVAEDPARGNNSRGLHG